MEQILVTTLVVLAIVVVGATAARIIYDLVFEIINAKRRKKSLDNICNALEQAIEEARLEAEKSKEKKRPASNRTSNRTCSVPGCKEKHCARGYCKKHYNAARNNLK